MKTIAYLRISKATEDSVSLERQKEQILHYAKAMELGPVEFMCDDGYSGYSDSRPQFKELTKLIKSKEVSTLIVHDLGRLSRKMSTVLNFFENLIEKQKIQFISLKEKIDTSTPVGKMLLSLIAMFNQFYRDEVSYKCKNAKMHKRERNEFCGGTIPFGFDVNEEKKLVINKKEKQTIKLMKKMRADGCSFYHIAETLTKINIKSKRGRTWSPAVIRYILTRSRLLT